VETRFETTTTAAETVSAWASATLAALLAVLMRTDKAAAAKAWREQGTESPWFKRWFGKSEVVDAEGKPLRVYHGTAVGSFSENAVKAQKQKLRLGYSQKHIDKYGPKVEEVFGTHSTGATDTGYMASGAYFTDDHNAASGYAETKRLGKNSSASVYPVYLALQNPYIHGVTNDPRVSKRSTELFEDYIRGKGNVNYNEYRAASS